MGFWKRYTNRCSKWENIVKDAQEAIANSNEKEGLTEEQIRNVVALSNDDLFDYTSKGWKEFIKQNIRLEEIGYYDAMEKNLSMSQITGPKSFKEFFVDHETGCLMAWEDTLAYYEAENGHRYFGCSQ